MASIVGSVTGFVNAGAPYTITTSGITMQADDVLFVVGSSNDIGDATVASYSPSGTAFTVDFDGELNGVHITISHVKVTSQINSVTINAPGQMSAAIAFVVRGAIVPLVVNRTTATGVGSVPDPPSRTAGATNSEMFIAFAGMENIDNSPGTISGYTAINNVSAQVGSVQTTCAAAYKTPIAANATNNPGAWSSWTSGSGIAWYAATISIEITAAADQSLTQSSKFNPGDTLFTPQVKLAQALTQSTKYTDTAETFYSPTVVRAGQLQPSKHTDNDNFFTPVVFRVLQQASPQLHSEPDTLLPPLVHREDAIITTVPVARGVSRSIMLVEIDALDADGNPSPLRFGTEGVMTVVEGAESAEHYEPRIIDPGNFEHHLFEPNRSFGSTSAGFGDVEIAAAPGARNGASTDAILDYAVDGRVISIYETDSKRTPKSEWILRLRGLVDYLVSDDAYNKLAFKISDPLSALEEPLLSEAFAGTTLGGGDGTVEGNESMTGVKKQKVYGYVRNIELQNANPFDLVYLVSNGPIVAVGVYDAGGALTEYGDFGTLGELLAWTQVPGNYATCVALGYVRLGSSPVGAVTADVVTRPTITELTAGQLAIEIIDEKFHFNTGTTSDELLVGSPDTLTTFNATISGSPLLLTENTSNSRHYARYGASTKETRAVGYTLVGEFLPVSRGFTLKLANSDNAQVAVTVSTAGAIIKQVERGGFALVSSEIEDAGGGYFRLTLLAVTNSATSVYVEIALANTTNESYLGNGTSGVRFRAMSLIADLPLDLSDFEQLDHKNSAIVGILVTGDDTVLEAVQKLVNSIGGYVTVTATGLLTAGRFDHPPEVAGDTRNLLILSPDASWSTTNATLTGNNPSTVKDNTADDLHFIRATNAKAASKLRYRFQAEFAYNGRDVAVFIGSDVSAAFSVIDLQTGDVVSSGAWPFYAASNDMVSTVDAVTAVSIAGGYWRITVDATTDDAAMVSIGLHCYSAADAAAEFSVSAGLSYVGDGTSGFLFRNATFNAINPSLMTISEEIIIGDSLQRLPTGDDGRGIPFWKVTGRWQHNWRVQKGTEVLPSVAQFFRVFLSQEWSLTTPLASDTIRFLHPSSTELVFDTYMANRADAQAETARRANLYGVQRNAYECEIPIRYSDDAALGSFVKLMSSRFGLENGKLMTVIGRLENFENRTVTLTLWG